MDKHSCIYVAGHQGMVGSAITRSLEMHGYTNVKGRSHADMDLTDHKKVRDWFAYARPHSVIVAASVVGGIMDNWLRPVDYLRDNVLMYTHLFDSAREFQVSKLLFLASSCCYPRDCRQPMREGDLLTGPLEPTNESYAMAKLTGITLCQAYRRQYGCDFITAIPTNLYGPHDHFDRDGAHVIPSLMRKFHEAKVNNTVPVLWGTGNVWREFLHVKDCAEACLRLFDDYSSEIPVNIGSGEEVSIRELASLVQSVVGYHGPVEWDATKPDGVPRKSLNSDRIRELGWTPTIRLRDGLTWTYQWFREHATAPSPHSTHEDPRASAYNTAR